MNGRSDSICHLDQFPTAGDNTAGRVQTFKDIYGHERPVKLGMEGRTAKIAAPKKEDLGEARRQVLARAGGRSGRLNSDQRSALGATNGLKRTRKAQSRPAPRERRTASRRWRRQVYGVGGDS